MSLKEFFKPTKLKITLAIIIFVLFSVIFRFPNISYAECARCMEGFDYGPCPIYLSFFGLDIDIATFGALSQLFILISVYLIEIIICYVTSCLAISIYKNTKQK